LQTYAEIDKRINENNAKIKAIEKGFAWSERNEPKIVADLKEQELLIIENKILYDNARRAYFAEVIDAVVAEFQKYKGKPYGEKTKDKIRESCKEKTGCAAYLSAGAWYETQKLVLVPLDANGFSGTGRFRYNDLDCYLTTKDDKGNHGKFLDENKIQEFSAEDIDICYGVKYVEDVRDRAIDMSARFAEAKAAWKQYEAACSAFNELTPSGIEHIDCYKNPRNHIL
jgi:hypothetical protein